MADKSEVKKEAVFKGKDAAKQIVYGVVSEPDSEDLQGDVLSADEIEKFAHGFMLDSRLVSDSHSKNKDGSLVLADAGIVESFLAPVDFQMENETVRKGSWVVAVKINDAEMWQAVEKGDITGFSIGGFGERVPV